MKPKFLLLLKNLTDPRYSLPIWGGGRVSFLCPGDFTLNCRLLLCRPCGRRGRSRSTADAMLMLLVPLYGFKELASGRSKEILQFKRASVKPRSGDSIGELFKGGVAAVLNGSTEPFTLHESIIR